MKYYLPDSANDLPIKDGKLLMRSLSIFEVLRRFNHIIRLTPFRFEDFTVALLDNEQSPLLAEVHIQLLRTLMREDRQQQTWLCPPDLRDAVNIYVHTVDHVTWPAALRIYLSADTKENSPILDRLTDSEGHICNYPLNVDLQVKLDVLEQLCDQFLLSNLAREEIVNGSNLAGKHDNICRLCSKANGDLIPCEQCPAVYHLKCSDPPLDSYPSTQNGDNPYMCAICRLNHITGVSDCIGLYEDSGNLKRLEPLGMDKLGRRFWFVIRRLFVVDETEEDVRYYSSLNQLEELIENLIATKSDKALIETIKEHRDEIERQMKVTDELYQLYLKEQRNEDGTYSKLLGQEGTHKNYVNHFATNNLAIGKAQHSERDVLRSLGHKFSAYSLNSFKWHGAIDGHLSNITVTIRSSILKFEANLPSTFIHPCWQAQRSKWLLSVNSAQKPEDYARALSLLECCIKPVLFKTVWYEGVGFCQLFRSTLTEREELKKTDRQPRGFERREWFSQDFELSYRLGTMVKFSTKLKPVKHQVWKQKGEEYRLTGLNGWLWRSCTLKPRVLPRPKLYKVEPWRWLSPMHNHPFVVDMIEEAIRSVDVIDVAANLSCDEYKRILYPKKPLLSKYKQERVAKLEGLLQKKLDKMEKARILEAKNEQNSQADEPNKKIKLENGGDQATNHVASPALNNDVEKKTILINGNGTNNHAAGAKKIIFFSANSQTQNLITLGSSINLLTTPSKTDTTKQQMLKKCVFAKPELPPCHDFLSKRGKLRSILILPDNEIHKLARSGGLKEAKSFSYTAKQNNYVWPYSMTPRPTFRTCWLYRNRIIETLQDVALQLKVIHGCLRWEDLQVRPPSSGHNVIVTDDSTVSIELLKKRDKLPYLTHSEYLIKKVTTPIEQPTKYRKVSTKKSTPSARSGLRARRQTEEDTDKGPKTEEVWVPEDQLELWELKQFDEKIERQNQLMRERALREEAERRRKLEEEKRRKADLERRRKEEEARKARLAQAAALNSNATTPNSASSSGTKPQIDITPKQATPTTPVLRYFRTEQGQIIRLPASYLQRGTPLILRHVGPGPNQTSTYIIRPQITPVTPNTSVVGQEPVTKVDPPESSAPIPKTESEPSVAPEKPTKEPTPTTVAPSEPVSESPAPTTKAPPESVSESPAPTTVASPEPVSKSPAPTTVVPPEPASESPTPTTPAVEQSAPAPVLQTQAVESRPVEAVVSEAASDQFPR